MSGFGVAFYREQVIRWSKDLRRSLDYLESRPDISMTRVGYLGLSWGSAIAPIMIATEPRISASVLVSGGLLHQPTQSEVDPFHFLPRVVVPTLMINIKNDFFFPVESSQKPFYEHLGAEQKDYILYEESSGHAPPYPFLVRHTLDWFDQYLDARD